MVSVYLLTTTTTSSATTTTTTTTTAATTWCQHLFSRPSIVFPFLIILPGTEKTSRSFRTSPGQRIIISKRGGGEDGVLVEGGGGGGSLKGRGK